MADGNCLFRAFSFMRERGNQENHMKYRNEVVQYLRLNKQEYQPIFENKEELEDYIKMIAKDRAWGGELEMSILSKLYKCGFLIHANNRPNISVSSLPVMMCVFYRLTAVKISKKNRYIIWHIILMNIITALSACRNSQGLTIRLLKQGTQLKINKSNQEICIGYSCSPCFLSPLYI